MPKDSEVILTDRPETLSVALEATGNAGINIDGASGGEGIIHILVEDAGVVRNALQAAGLEVRRDRGVAVAAVDNEPGGRPSRRIDSAGGNVDLAHITADDRMV